MEIVIDKINKSFGKNLIVKDISFSIKEGKITALVGENGSGKTTIMKIISGLYKSDSGNVYNLPYKENIVDVCAVIENSSFNGMMNCKEILKYYVDLNVEKREEFDYYIKLFNIDFLEKSFYKLSLGMKQKLSIIYMFLKKSKLVLLDEITNGLDKNTVKIFYEELKRYVIENNAYVLISSHKLNEIQMICDYVYFLKNNSISNLVDIKNELSNNKMKSFIFLEKKDALNFMGEINKSTELINENEVIVYYESLDDISYLISIANKHKVDQIKKYDLLLEDIYMQYLRGDKI